MEHESTNRGEITMAVTAKQARALAGALPEVEERSHFEVADFRVGGKIFATLPDAARMVVRLDPAEQAALIAAEPDTYSADGYWGRQGWTEVDLDKVDVADLRELLTEAWLRRAPARLRRARTPPEEQRPAR